MVRGVKCAISDECGPCLDWSAIAASGQFVSPPVAENWQLLDGIFTLDKSGGNDFL